MVIKYLDKAPRVGKNVFIAPTATVIGDVTIGDHSSVWFGAVIRGDLAPVTIGCNTNIQDNCTLHVDKKTPLVIGDNVTVGHNAVVHGCTLKNRCLVGINAVVLNKAVVETGTIVAAGSVVREGQAVGPNQLVAGIPVRVKKELGPGEIARIDSAARNYLEAKEAHQENEIIS